MASSTAMVSSTAETHDGAANSAPLLEGTDDARALVERLHVPTED